jgi:hypothetical protein
MRREKSPTTSGRDTGRVFHRSMTAAASVIRGAREVARFVAEATREGRDRQL